MASSNRVGLVLAVLVPVLLTAPGSARVASAARRPLLSEAQIGAGYRTALTLLAGGDVDAAKSTLIETESRAIGNASQEATDRLLRAELAVIRQLISDQQIEILVPVLMLHHDVYETYLGSHAYALARHARRAAAELADFYADRGGSEGSRVVASRVAASLGGYLQEGGARYGGASFYQRALELDSRNVAALIGLATVYEKSGLYKEAVGYLERLREADPRDAQGRLRLAVNLERLDRRQEAEELLSGLIDDSNLPGWITVLAYEELAESWAARERFADASDLLKKACVRLPRVQRLALQRAFLLERSGHPSDAQRVIAAVEEGDATGETPRARYNDFPSDPFVALRMTLHESASSRRALLAQVLFGLPHEVAQP